MIDAHARMHHYLLALAAVTGVKFDTLCPIQALEAKVTWNLPSSKLSAAAARVETPIDLPPSSMSTYAKAVCSNCCKAAALARYVSTPSCPAMVDLASVSLAALSYLQAHSIVCFLL